MSQNETSSSSRTRRRAWLPVLGLLAVIVGAFFVGLGDDLRLNSHEALLAVSRAATLDRCAVRQDAVARFGRDRMVDAYVEVYERVVSDGH